MQVLKNIIDTNIKKLSQNNIDSIHNIDVSCVTKNVFTKISKLKHTFLHGHN